MDIDLFRQKSVSSLKKRTRKSTLLKKSKKINSKKTVSQFQKKMLNKMAHDTVQ